ncbi:histidine kinase [Leptospira perolatii]|uniref:histidine kinase n=1 Tax=Leptospira perolatii TaxID=2023191 RepID=A0A2M9ZND0_9LEPT|nr:ATP-binding protein [Leptospira perolatii]PJZ68929.1 histidine kinase [Leptospira perolatii]PJZ73453.1 histidine kinase [Leptospira perolatii]
MIHLVRNILFVFLLSSQFLQCGLSPSRASLTDGSLDWDFVSSNERVACVRLNGSWKFAWLGEEPKRELPKEPKEFGFQTVPGSWTGEIWQGKILPSNGKALYRLELYSSGPVESLHLLSFDQGTNYRILFNGVPIHEVGRVGDPSLDALSLLTSYVVLPTWSKKANLDFEISNYNYRKGGLWKPPVLGKAECLNRFYLDRRDLEAIVSGGMLFLSLFHIFVSVFYKQERSALVLGFFCLSVFLRLYSTGHRLLPEHFEVGHSVYLRIEFISWFMSMPLGVHFLYLVFPTELRKIGLYMGYAVAIGFSLITLATNPATYSHLIVPSYGLYLGLGLNAALVLGDAVRRGWSGAWIYLIGFLSILLMVGSEILYHSEVMDSWELGGVGVALFVLSNALSLSQKLLHEFKEKERVQEMLNRNLEELVGRRTKELESARDEAQAANRAKSEFLINVDHEVRTPMNGIMGITEMLLDSELKPDQREMVELLKRSGDAMMIILGTMLDASNLEKGTLLLLSKKFVLRAALYEAAMRIEHLIKRKGVKFTVDITENLPEAAMGDEERFKKMILGLLENAEKFTKEGEISLKAELLEETDHNYKLRFVVEDTGIGIPEDKLNTIFTPFQQVDSGVTKPFQGAGLGLSLCRALARKMDGDVYVRSEPGKGSAFTLELYLAKPEIQP